MSSYYLFLSLVACLSSPVCLMSVILSYCPSLSGLVLSLSPACLVYLSFLLYYACHCQYHSPITFCLTPPPHRPVIISFQPLSAYLPIRLLPAVQTSPPLLLITPHSSRTPIHTLLSDVSPLSITPALLIPPSPFTVLTPLSPFFTLHHLALSLCPSFTTSPHSFPRWRCQPAWK